MEAVAEIPLWLVITVVAAALVVGVIMIGVVLKKYATDEWFDKLGGPTLTVCGVALIGLTVYGNVTLKVGEFEAEFSRLQASLETRDRQVKTLRRQFSNVSNELVGILEAVDLATDYVAKNESLANNEELWVKITTAQRKVRDLDEQLHPRLAIMNDPDHETVF